MQTRRLRNMFLKNDSGENKLFYTRQRNFIRFLSGKRKKRALGNTPLQIIRNFSTPLNFSFRIRSNLEKNIILVSNEKIFLY